MQRDSLGSRLGFILISAGCAIGIGNVWKFPYMAGSHGGAIFVLFYLFFLIFMGVPVMTMEFSVGRASRKSPAKIYHELAPDNKKWRIHSYASVVGNYLIMMFYTSVTGWLVQYFVRTATGQFKGLEPEAVNKVYDNMIADPITLIISTFGVIFIGFFVCSFSLQKGLEKVTKIMMLALLGLMIFLAVNSIFLEGGKAGLEFYLKPNLSTVKEVGITNVISGAMSQAFFTLSLGIGSMAIFGSYIKKDRALLGESVTIAVLDTFVALCSGLIIFPACFAFNDGKCDAGPPLIFKTLPNIFNKMPFGTVLGSLFFVFLCFAAFSTVFAVFENIIACCMDLFNWTRKKACIVNAIIMPVLSLPCVFGSNILSSFKFPGDSNGFLALEDFIVSYLLLPLGSLVFVIFCTSRYGWGFKNFTQEANTGKGLKIKNWMRLYMTYVLPVIILILFIIGIYPMLK